LATLTLTINGVARTVEAEPEMPLLWALRDLLGLTGTKFGCGVGLCGACTVLADGAALRSCSTPVSAAAGRAITTIEGLASDGAHPVQQAWLAEAVSQCGYCQAGQIMTAVALLGKTPQPTDAEIDAAFADTLCRCGTYLRIRRAIHRAAGG
jgi:aerobic-type carbon monoxide dehydrogenase small subunit (CoxS/CutS family)